MKRIRTFSDQITFVLSLFILLLLPMTGQAQTEDYTYKLTQTTPSYQFWTTPPSERVFKTDIAPTDIGSRVNVYAAKNETEPFQIVVKPTSTGNVTVSVGSFGSGITTELFQVKYVNVATATDYLGKTGLNPDPLWPLASGASVSLTANQNTAFWISVYVPSTTAAGNYTMNVTIGGVNIPVRLHVFNFAIPAQLHVKSQMNFSYSTLLTKYGVSEGDNDPYWLYVDKIKQFFIDHRLTPKSVLWSGGLTTNGAEPYIYYNCAGTFTDNDGIWGFVQPAQRYLNGTGLMGGKYSTSFNGGVGFPSFMAATFQSNDASEDPRPNLFCGQTKSSSDWLANPTSAYNTKWFQYMTAMQNYLSSLGYLDEAYYYFANEPQDTADYNAVAWYSRYLKQYAPNLKLMVSEEPKPEIYNHANYVHPHQIDIWLPHFGLFFNPTISQQRLKNNGEESWIYFLKSTYLPRFNSITLDHPAIEGKFLGWFLWKYRVRGVAYYTFNDWSSNPWTDDPNPSGKQNGEMFLMYPPAEDNNPIAYGSNGDRFVPSIRLEMIRDGLEDYEYFYLLSGGQPQPDVTNAADAQVNKVINMPTSYTRDSDFMYNLRRLIGLKLGGESATIPDIAPASVHARSNGAPGNYYINFQNPSGEPWNNPLIVNGHEYLKIGNAQYDPTKGYGWYRAADTPQSNFYTDWDQWVETEPRTLLGSSVIDSWGREDVFEFDLPNGTYNVTVCAGSRSSPRYQNIVIEGVMFINDEITNNSWITRTKTVTVQDKKLSVQMGKYERIGYINYVNIEAAPSNNYLLWTK